MKRTRSWLTWVPVLLLACGSGSDNGPSTFDFTGPGTTTPGNGATGTGTGNGTGTGTGTGSSGVGGGGTGSATKPAIEAVSPAVAVCAQDMAIADVKPLDIFLMVDRSISMDEKTASGESKWVVISGALKAFLNDPESAGVKVGLGFFPRFIEEPPPRSGTPDCTCDVPVYATPAVPMGLLPDNAGPMAAEFDARYPVGETPTRVAQLGAISYAQAFAAANPNDRVVIVVATDGNPNVCRADENVNPVLEVSNAARTGVALSIRSYVIGVITADKPDKIKNLNQMALGGGTGAAFIVDPISGTGDQFVQAMRSIRSSNKMVCQYAIPRAATGELIDYEHATVLYSAGGGASTPLTWRRTAADCGQGEGFFYDNNYTPGSIKLCSTTCAQVQADPGAKVDWMFDCEPPPPPPPPPSEGTGGALGTGGTVETGGTPEPPPPEPPPQGGYGGEPEVTVVCLERGMSCTDGSECCIGVCNSRGVCGIDVN